MKRPFGIFLACGVAFGAGCKTGDKADSGAPFLDGEELPVGLEQESQDNLPASLWSPMRRKANASFYFMAAENELMAGNNAKSLELFQAAYNLDPNAFLAWKMIAAEANAGDIDSAITQAKKMVLLYPKYPELHALFGQMLARRGLFDDAIKSFEKAIALKPDLLEAYLGLIQLHQMRKAPNDAIAVAKDLIKADPTFADGWAMLAKLYLATNQKKATLEPARRAYELQGMNPENALIYALALELNGESKKAVHLYEVLFRLNPNNEELIGRMVDLYRQLGDLNNALNLIDEAIASSKEPPAGLRMQRAFILWELERFKEASTILEQLLAENPSSDRLLYMAALGRERLEQYDRALEAFQKIPAESQYRIHADFRTVNILRSQERFDEAMAIVQRVIKSGNERAVDFYGVGASVLADANRLPEAVNLLESGTKAHPDDIQMLFLLGVYHEKNNDKASCIEVMREVIKRDPKHSSAHNYLGYLFAESGENLEEAEQLISKALELKPGDGYYMDSLGWVYYQRKEYEKALETLKKADKLTPNEGVVLEHIGDTYRALKQVAEAKDYYRKALSGQIEKADRARVEKKLKELEDTDAARMDG